MDTLTQRRLITWIKRILGFTAIAVWVYIIFIIASSTVPFMEQAPYCMFSTMLIFGLLTGVFKGLDYWSLNTK